MAWQSPRAQRVGTLYRTAGAPRNTSVGGPCAPCAGGSPCTADSDRGASGPAAAAGEATSSGIPVTAPLAPRHAFERRRGRGDAQLGGHHARHDPAHAGVHVRPDAGRPRQNRRPREWRGLGRLLAAGAFGTAGALHRSAAPGALDVVTAREMKHDGGIEAAGAAGAPRGGTDSAPRTREPGINPGPGHGPRGTLRPPASASTTGDLTRRPWRASASAWARS